MTQPDSLAAIIAEMREPENSGQFGPWQITAANIKDWADRLAALAGAAPVDLFAKAVPTRYVSEHGQDIDMWVRLHEAATHAPAKAREDDGMDERDAAELLRLRYAMGERLKLVEAIELLRAAVSPSGADFCMCPELERRIEAALATFAEGE